MTTTVTVKTRGLGADVTVGAEQVKMGPNSQRRFETDDTMSLSLRQHSHEEQAAAEAAEQPPADAGQVTNETVASQATDLQASGETAAEEADEQRGTRRR